MIFLTLFKLQYDPSRTPHRNFINDLLAEYEISANSVYQDASQQLDGFFNFIQAAACRIPAARLTCIARLRRQ